MYKTIAILIVLFGIIASSFMAWNIYSMESESIYEQFRKDVDDKVNSLDRQLTMNYEVLYSLRGLYNSSKDVTSAEFDELANDILTRHKAIKAVEWIPRVSAAERALYESNRRKEIPGFNITERKSQGVMVPASEREEYFPAYFVSPYKGNEIALGFDLSSNPVRREALELSRSSGNMQSTATVTLVQETGNQKGFLTFLPIYDGEPASARERNEKLKGFVLGVYRIGDIVKTAMAHTAAKGINISLIDITSPAKPDTIYIYKAGGDIFRESMTYRKELLHETGRQWIIVACPSEWYVADRRSFLPYVIFILGITFTISATTISIWSLRRTHIVEQMVQERTKELNETNTKLRLLSKTDGLTGISNRRFLDEYLERAWKSEIRNQGTFSILMIDIDHFKQFNDHYGHLAGDECLKTVAQALAPLMHRPSDLFARYGGEEFIVVLPDTNDAYTIAERCREAVWALHIPHKYSAVSNQVTISIGIGIDVPAVGSTPDALIHKADEALYRAKREGRNRIVCYQAVV
ncbi:MAG: diguanylate cyclase [Chlorobiales bacterium]|nr:diguanylate cyclase [Chlorobiales bacterium]